MYDSAPTPSAAFIIARLLNAMAWKLSPSVFQVDAFVEARVLRQRDHELQQAELVLDHLGARGGDQTAIQHAVRITPLQIADEALGEAELALIAGHDLPDHVGAVRERTGQIADARKGARHVQALAVLRLAKRAELVVV